jgi:hypothetical protein
LHSCYVPLELTGLGVFFAGLGRRKELGTQKCAVRCHPAIPGSAGRTSTRSPSLWNRDTTTKLAIVGKHAAEETPDAAAERDLNVTQYLLEEKGIDPSRIGLRTGCGLNCSLDDILVPASAGFIPGDTFDSNSVKRHGQPYAKPQNRH